MIKNRLKFTLYNLALMVSTLSYILHFKFLITSYIYYYIFLLISIILGLIIIYKFNGSILFFFKLKYVIFISILSTFFIINYILSLNGTNHVLRVKLNGYYTSRAGGISFKFNGVTFTRPASIPEELLENYKNDKKLYFVKISLIECSSHCYFIEKMEIIKDKL